MSTRPLFKEVAELIARTTKITIPPHGVVGEIFSWIMQYFVGNNQGGNMRIRAWYPIVAVVAISLLFTAFSSTADAKRYYGACGGGTTLKDNIAGWKQHGVLDDVARSTGQKPGVDGPAAKIVKDNMVPVYLVKGTWVTNYNCSNGRFVRLNAKKYLPAGTKLWMPEKNAPAKGKSKYVSKAEQANCGNRATGKMLVKRKGHSKPKPKPKTKAKPKTPVAVPLVCPVNTVGIVTNTGIACQSNSSTQTADQKSNVENDCKGPNTNSSQCLTSITNIIQQTTIQVNANCSKVTITNSDGLTFVEYKDNNGNVVTESYCSTTVIEQPPVCTYDCFPHVDNGPQIECTFPAHMMLVPGSMQPMYCVSSDPEGDTLSVNVVSNDNSIVTVSGVDNHYEFLFDGKTKCPSGSVCTKANIWAHQLGLASVTATATANGKSATSTGWFPVVAGDSNNF